MTHTDTNETRGTDMRSPTKLSHTTYRPPVDLYEFSDRYEIHADLPGADSGSIDVRVQDGELCLFAEVPDRYDADITPLHLEYGIGGYRRRIRLGEDIDLEQLDACFRDGVLTISLPKRADQQPRRIQVRTA